jgi:hypothetical protein
MKIVQAFVILRKDGVLHVAAHTSRNTMYVHKHEFMHTTPAMSLAERVNKARMIDRTHWRKPLIHE